MTIKIVDTVTDDMIEAVWDLYYNAFKDLNALTVQRHLMYRSEFDEVMGDERVQKYLCVADDDSLCGLSTYTNDLDAMPLISPEYFQRRWPEHFAEKRIWYCGFVAVDRMNPARSASGFGELVEAMYLTAATQNGIIGLDFCRYNDIDHHMARVIELKLHRLSGKVISERMDEQAFYLYEFPNAA
jgi:hypothetical protein